YRRGEAFYAVADAERCWLCESWPEPPRRELTRVSTLPTLTPLLARRQLDVPYVVALVDREGADIVVVERGGAAHDQKVSGASGPIRKSAPGGWSQKRYQTRAEETWARTSRDIAEEIVADVDASGAELVVLAG